MEVYEALRDFTPQGAGDNTLSLRTRDRVEVLEHKKHRHYRQWWGVRRLRDHVVGFVPAKHLQYDETIPVHLLPDGYQQQKLDQLSQLESMQRANQLPVPGFSTPPLRRLPRDVDRWRTPNYRGSLPALHQLHRQPEKGFSYRRTFRSHERLDEPAPDYSDDENELPRNGLYHANGRDSKHNGKPAGGSLTAQDWQNIVAAAEADTDFPAPPPTILTPEPDYQGHMRPFGGSSENIPQVIRPHPNSTYGSHGDGGAINKHKLRNPCLESKERMAVHKELLMTSKMGFDVLNKKSELRRALDKRADERRKKEREEYIKSRKTEFQKTLEEQAHKYEQYERAKKSPVEKSPPVEADQPEFLRVHSRIYKTKSS